MKNQLAFLLFFPFTCFCMNIPQEAREGLLNIARQDCTICSDRMIEDLVITKCNHLFHKNCLKKWHEKSNLCPICRANVHKIRSTTALKQVISALSKASVSTAAVSSTSQNQPPTTASSSSTRNIEEANKDLLKAAEHGDLTALNRALEKGADIDARSYPDGPTALCLAAIHGHLQIIDRLLKAKANLHSTTNYSGFFGGRALHYAAFNGNKYIVDLLLKKGAGIDINKPESSPLAWAIDYYVGEEKFGGERKDTRYQGTEPIELLLKAGADPNGISHVESQSTVLHSLAESWKSDGCTLEVMNQTLDLLLKAGADLNAQDKDGRTPLMLAIGLGRIELAKKLISIGAKIDIKDKEGSTALFEAAGLGGRDKCLPALLEAGTPVHQLDKKGASPLHYAASSGAIFGLNALLRAGANVHQCDAEGNTPLHCAALWGPASCVHALLRAGASIHQLNFDRNTPLMLAIRNERRHIVDLLRRAEENLSTQNSKGKAPLSVDYETAEQSSYSERLFSLAKHASRWGGFASTSDQSQLEQLLKEGVDMHAIDDFDQTVLDEACGSENYPAACNTLKLLLDAGANVYVVHKTPDKQRYEKILQQAEEKNILTLTPDGRSALHWAAIVGKVDLIQKALKAGVKVNLKDNEGRTALHEAALYGREDIVNLLLNYGANIFQSDYAHKNSLHNASMGGHKETIDLLLKASGINR